MPFSPTFLKPVADAIGDALTIEQLEDIVIAATGSGLFEEFAAPSDPRRLAVRRTLERLIQDGTERWLLTYVLISADADDRLRRLIVKACPETLVSLPFVDQQVDRALQSLDKVMIAALASDFKSELKPSRDKLSAISRQVATLFTYKTLHECLHALHLKLAFKSALDAAVNDQARLRELKDGEEKIERSCTTAREAAASLDDADSQVEVSWIAELERLSKQLQSTIAASNADEAAGIRAEVQRLIRLQLSRLNKNIFEAARQLSLHELIVVLPTEIKLEDSFFQLSHAVRELKTSVIARALVHKIWQDVDNELSLIEGFLDVPANGAAQFAEHWLTLKLRILWLGTLDPDAEWSKEAKKYSEHIDDELTEEKLDNDVKPTFETYCRIVKFRFFAVDATLKADCGSLGKFHAPLKRIVEEISNG